MQHSDMSRPRPDDLVSTLFVDGGLMGVYRICRALHARCDISSAEGVVRHSRLLGQVHHGPGKCIHLRMMICSRRLGRGRRVVLRGGQLPNRSPLDHQLPKWC